MDKTLQLLPEVNANARERAEIAPVEHSRVNPVAFESIYRSYAPQIYGYCLRCLRSREDAEDATSKVFTLVIAKRHLLRDDNIRPWIFRIAHNVVIDHSRRTRRTEPLSESLPTTDSANSPEAIAISHDLRARIDDALSSLSERDRHLVHLRLAGLSGAEIAAVLDCSHAAVRTAHHRAVQRLRTVLTDLESDHE